jgi:hypothetical protein
MVFDNVVEGENGRMEWKKPEEESAVSPLVIVEDCGCR